jgi:Family of unknown function (DUF5947)
VEGRTSSGLGRFLQPRPRAGEATAPEALARLMRQRQGPPGERCEMCGAVIPEEHSHVVNVESRNLMCTCRPCYLLFTPEGAGQGKYRAVPDRYLYDPSFKLTDRQWDAVQIPVRMAFFFYNSSLEKVVAFYPSPAGATESLLSLETWDDIIEANPLFSTLVPDVEALLIYRSDEGFECYLAPIDACYELVGLVKLHWKGFDGGREAWRAIDSFFSGLRDRSSATSGQGAHE